MFTSDYLNRSFFVLENWQWIGLVGLVLVGFLAANLMGFMINLSVQKKWAPYFEQLDERVRSRFLSKPFSVFILGWIWLFGLKLLRLPAEAIALASPGAKIISYAGLVWAIWRGAELIGLYLKDKAAQSHNKFDDLLAPIIQRSIRVLAVIVGILSFSEILKLPLSSLIAGLGIGGIAIAMAAKDTIANVFGSVTVLLDRPFNIGDSVVIGSTQGTVEQVGFRSTRVRTFYGSLITVPNANLLTAVVDNMGARQFRRLRCFIGLTYDTPAEKIEAFCEGVNELIRLHPLTRKDSYNVAFDSFGDFSLNILLLCYFIVPDYSTEVSARHQFLLDVKRLGQQIGVEFAFPTQTIYLEKDTSPAPFSASQSPDTPPVVLASRDQVMALKQSGKQAAESIFNTYKDA